MGSTKLMPQSCAQTPGEISEARQQTTHSHLQAEHGEDKVQTPSVQKQPHELEGTAPGGRAWGGQNRKPRSRAPRAASASCSARAPRTAAPCPSPAGCPADRPAVREAFVVNYGECGVCVQCKASLCPAQLEIPAEMQPGVNAQCL